MSLHITFRKIEATDALKNHVEEKVEKFKKFISYPMETHVFLSIEKDSHTAEIKCHAEHREIVAKAKEEDLYAAIDVVCHKIEAQLKKEREKKKGHAAAHKTARRTDEELATELVAEVPHLGKRSKAR